MQNQLYADTEDWPQIVPAVLSPQIQLTSGHVVLSYLPLKKNPHRSGPTPLGLCCSRVNCISFSWILSAWSRFKLMWFDLDFWNNAINVIWDILIIKKYIWDSYCNYNNSLCNKYNKEGGVISGLDMTCLQLAFLYQNVHLPTVTVALVAS